MMRCRHITLRLESLTKAGDENIQPDEAGGQQEETRRGCLVSAGRTARLQDSKTFG